MAYNSDQISKSKTLVLPIKTRATLISGEYALDTYGNIIYNDGNRIITIPKSTAQTAFLRVNGTGTNNTNGILSNNMLLSATNTGISSSSGFFGNYASGTTANTFANIYPNVLQIRIDNKFLSEQKFVMNDTSNCRFFVGITDSIANGGMSGADNPSLTYLGLQFSTNRGDTNFQFVYTATDGGTQTLINTGIAPNTAKFYSLEMDCDGTSITPILYDNETPVWTTTISSGLPTTTTLMGLKWIMETLTTASKSFKVFGTSSLTLRIL